MFEVMIMYSEPEVFSLCQDIKRILPDTSFALLKEAVRGGILNVTEDQYIALQRLIGLYKTLEIEKM